MFKSTVIAATVATAINAIGLEADVEDWEPTHQPSAWTIENYHGENYYTNPGYHAPSYEHEYGEVLPGADFNKQVWQFNPDHQIWDQNDYEERVKVEAEMLVALEAMKDAVHDLDRDIERIDYRNHDQEQRIGANQEDVWENHQKVNESLASVYHRVEQLQETCQHTEHELEEAKQALILYCQQFAFAHDMVPVCAEICNCRDTQIYPRYAFHGDYHGHHDDVHHHDSVHDHHDDEHNHYDDHHDEHYPEYISSHGMDLFATGGGEASYGVSRDYHPEIAAAAHNSNEAVIVYGNQSFLAPVDQINPDSVELACNLQGVALIPDDGDDSNNLWVDPNDPNVHYHPDGSMHDMHADEHDHYHDGHFH